MHHVIPAATGWQVVALEDRNVVSFTEVLAFAIDDLRRITPVTFAALPRDYVLMRPNGSIEPREPTEVAHFPCLDAYRLFRYGVHDPYRWGDANATAEGACRAWAVQDTYLDIKQQIHKILVSQGRT